MNALLFSYQWRKERGDMGEFAFCYWSPYINVCKIIPPECTKPTILISKIKKKFWERGTTLVERGTLLELDAFGVSSSP